MSFHKESTMSFDIFCQDSVRIRPSTTFSTRWTTTSLSSVWFTGQPPTQMTPSSLAATRICKYFWGDSARIIY